MLENIYNGSLLHDYGKVIIDLQSLDSKKRPETEPRSQASSLRARTPSSTICCCVSRETF